MSVTGLAFPGLLLGLLAFPLAAQAATTIKQTAAICQGRAGCALGKTADAGKSLTVVQANIAGCSEYWLVEGTQPARQLLKLCKGDGSVIVGANLLTHKQSGTSDIVWERTVAYSLSPWRPVSERGCSYHPGTADGTATDLDFASMRLRSIDKDSTVRGATGCPAWTENFTATPAPGLRGGYNVAAPVLDKDVVGSKVTIGDCVPSMTTAGVNGFVTRGAPAAADKAAEIKVVSESISTLLVQVFDPSADKASRVEVWFPAAKDLARIGIDVAGPASAPSANKDVLPSVQRWQATDERSRPVTMMRLSWANQSTLFSGMAIAYAQNDNGKPVRVVANTSIVNDRPAYLPKIVSFADSRLEPAPGVCKARDGRLMRD